MTATQITHIDVTDVDSSHTDFSPVVKFVIIKNTGVNKCYINLNAAATTSHFQIDPDEELTLILTSITDVHAICDSTKTTMLRIAGVATW